MTPLQLHLSGAPQSNRSLRQPSDTPSLFLLHSKMIFSLFFLLRPPSTSNSLSPFLPSFAPSCTLLKQFSGKNVFLIRDKMMFHFSRWWGAGKNVGVEEERGGGMRGKRREDRGEETSDDEWAGQEERKEEE